MSRLAANLAALAAARAKPRFVPLPPSQNAVVARIVACPDRSAAGFRLVAIEFADAPTRYHWLRQDDDGSWMEEVLFPGAIATLQPGPTETHPECMTFVDDLRLGTHWRYDADGVAHKAPTGDASLSIWPVVPLFRTPELALQFVQ